jgi:glycosyltransferase involved in cell wall biosynthesis
MKRLKILCLFDYAATTGFATISKNIVPRIKEYFGAGNIVLDICAINYFGDLYKEDDYTTVFSALKSAPINKVPGMKDDFGRYGFLSVLSMSNDSNEKDGAAPSQMGYDGVFIIQDPGIINSLVRNMEVQQRLNKENNRKQFKSIVYFPIDHEIGSAAMIEHMLFFDEIVTYNEFCRKQVLKLRPNWFGKLKVIPHGMNLDHFYPVDQERRQAFRQEYFKENANKFIVLNVNRNQSRKDIPCTIFAFKEYRKQNKDAFLYLHMNPKDPLGWDLRAIMGQAGLVEGRDFMFPPAAKENHDTSIETLNLIYNSSDVFVTTTLGEGWGLTVTEAMACKLPVICPLHTSLIDISDNGKRVYPLENLYPICQIADNDIREQCDFVEVAAQLHQVYTDLKTGSAALTKKVNLAYQYIQTLDWNIIGKQWGKLMSETY